MKAGEFPICGVMKKGVTNERSRMHDDLVILIATKPMIPMIQNGMSNVNAFAFCLPFVFCVQCALCILHI